MVVVEANSDEEAMNKVSNRNIIATENIRYEDRRIYTT